MANNPSESTPTSAPIHSSATAPTLTEKTQQLEAFQVDGHGKPLTTNQGVPVLDNQNSLKAGSRGPTLLEDFMLREKITHFDHERIPERVVHARGAAAHGYFQVYEPMASFTSADFLNDPNLVTPVFVRFSTVGGSRGSADTVRDVRGFATKFYTRQGNFDLVGNNMPVFFIQDAIKFPDFVHAVKPEPHREIPQASSAHDTFYDFVTQATEATHMLFWLMSDRAIPTSLRTMEGFGVHTFRFINAQNESHFVKFHWKPKLGVRALVWDEAQKLAGKDPDFHRRDLWETIQSGNFPEWDLGVQVFTEDDAKAFDFDVLDATKLIPEELVPVRRIGKMVLNRNPENYFAETEQVAFCASHVVPGIDFSNDPLLQGRLFSYLDTQLTRLGGPNFHEIPINRPVCPFQNGQRDGMHRMTIDVGHVGYEPSALEEPPHEVMTEDGGFTSFLERIADMKRRLRSDSFKDHYSQATMFYRSLTKPEQEHIAAAFRFELSMCQSPSLRERMVAQLENVDTALAAEVAAGLGLKTHGVLPTQVPTPTQAGRVLASPALSIESGPKDSIATRKVAILAADGVDGDAITALRSALQGASAQALVLSSRLGSLHALDGSSVAIDHTFKTHPSLMFDAVFIPGGNASVAELLKCGDALYYLREAYRHYKTIGSNGEAERLLEKAGTLGPQGIVIGKQMDASVTQAFITAMKVDRHWQRSDAEAIPA